MKTLAKTCFKYMAKGAEFYAQICSSASSKLYRKITCNLAYPNSKIYSNENPSVKK